MIVYDLICEEHHTFEGWFKSIKDYERQVSSQLINCPSCHSNQIRKIPTASYISKTSRPSSTASELSVEQNVVQAVADYIVANTEDVGCNFVEEAKKIHYGEVAAKNIRGIANKEEVQDLSDEGINVISLPGTVTEKQKLN